MTTANDRAALDLLTCTHYGRELAEAIEQLNHNADLPVVHHDARTGEHCEEHTAIEALDILLTTAARARIEGSDHILDSTAVSLELAAIDQFRALADWAQTIWAKAEHIADILRQPYLADASDAAAEHIGDEPCF